MNPSPSPRWLLAALLAVLCVREGGGHRLKEGRGANAEAQAIDPTPPGERGDVAAAGNGAGAEAALAPAQRAAMEAELREWLHRPGGMDSPEALGELDAIIERYGVEAVRGWKDTSNKHSHALIHHLALKGASAAVEHIVSKHKFDINAQRGSDGCTAVHLGIWFNHDDLVKKLWALGADVHLKNKYGESADDKWQAERAKHDYMIHVDLELTAGAFDPKHGPPKILEVAIVITDKDLVEKARGQWVIGGYSKEQLDALGEFHQHHFRDALPGGEFPPLPITGESGPSQSGGNGLFSDVLASKLTLAEVEEAMLAMVKSHCLEGICPLVGYSVQWDLLVLSVEMPRFARYLSHQIIDLSTLLRLGRLWRPLMFQEQHQRLSKYDHRAMHDVEDCIERMAWMRDNLFLALPAPEDAGTARGRADTDAPADEHQDAVGK